MSEFFTGITFPQQKVAPSYDAVIRKAMLADGVLSGCELSYSGYTLTMGTGLMIACGRQFMHTSVQNWPVTGATSGYARLLLTIDTMRASTKEKFDQIVASIEYASSVDGFLDLLQEDINQSGTIYQLPVCVVSLGAGGITGIVYSIKNAAVAAASASAISVTLAASGWVNNSQTVSVGGLTEDTAVVVSSDPSNHVAYVEAGIYCYAQGDGTLSFKCEDVPAINLSVNVVLLGVSGVSVAYPAAEGGSF